MVGCEQGSAFLSRPVDFHPARHLPTLFAHRHPVTAFAIEGLRALLTRRATGPGSSRKWKRLPTLFALLELCGLRIEELMELNLGR